MTDVNAGGPRSAAVDLVRLWCPAPDRAAAARVAELLAALFGAQVGQDTLGVHHQRMLDLHRRLVARPLDAVVDCPGCGTECEFAVPAVAIRGLPVPPPQATVELDVGDAVARFRLPRMADLSVVAGTTFADGIAALAALVCLEEDPPALSDADLARLAAEWEELDPAAAVRVDLACAGCGAEVSADVAVAEFVAEDLDRTVDGLLRDVDVLARAYGWSEDAILAMPAERRRRYIGLVGRPGGRTDRHLAAVTP